MRAGRAQRTIVMATIVTPNSRPKKAASTMTSGRKGKERVTKKKKTRKKKSRRLLVSLPAPYAAADA